MNTIKQRIAHAISELSEVELAEFMLGLIAEEREACAKIADY